MKKIEIIIKPFLVDDVREALAYIGITGVIVTEVKSFEQQKDHLELYCGTECVVDFLPKVKLEWVIAESQVEQCIDTITQVTRTNIIGDSKIFIMPVEKMIPIHPSKTIQETI